MSEEFQSLVSQFSRLPGIGARQARRIVEHLVREDGSSLARFARSLEGVQASVRECTSCFRLCSANEHEEFCAFCQNDARERTKRMIVAKDVDIDAIEKSGAYSGLYIVLGSILTLTEKEPAKKLNLSRITSLLMREGNDIEELIFALPTTTDGEETVRFLEDALADISREHAIRHTHLGRGLSTGAELEYADPETIKNALGSRK